MDTSPFIRLPPELIGLIFTHTLPFKPSFSSSQSPYVLTRVCRAWRTVALSTHRIWAALAIPDWQELPPNSLQLVKLWVDRARETPLDVDVSLFNEDVMIFPESEKLEALNAFLKDVLLFLEPHRGRIAKLRGVFPRFLIRDVGVPQMVNAEHIYYCGMLGDSIAIQGLEPEHVEQQESKLDIGPPRDTLRFLAVCGTAVELESVKVQSQLTHLELLDLHRGGDLCQESALQILQCLPKLKTCVMDLSRTERTEWTALEQRLALPSIELLFLSWVFPADIDLFLNSIATPKLIKFGLRGTPLVAQTPWNGLYNFLEASKPPIQRISFGDFGAVDAQLLRCFALLPDLAHVTLNHCEIPDATFRALTCTDETSDSHILRNLQVFNIGVCEGFQLQSVLNFLKSRSNNRPGGVEKLTEVAIMYCMAIEEKDAPALRSCSIENLILEAAEDDSVYPYARVVETHRELLAVLYDVSQEEVPFPDVDNDDEWEDIDDDFEGAGPEQNDETESNIGNVGEQNHA